MARSRLSVERTLCCCPRATSSLRARTRAFCGPNQSAHVEKCANRPLFRRGGTSFLSFCTHLATMTLGDRSVESGATETPQLLQISQGRCAQLYGLQGLCVLRNNEDLRFLEQSARHETWTSAFEWFVRRFESQKRSVMKSGYLVFSRR
jgi:hypothetical protein